MKSSSGTIDIAANARKLNVDNRISLRCYYRIADNLVKQADIYREEKNIIDLYVMLLRFSSLITETIPYHQDFQVSLQNERLYFKKKLLSTIGELEVLKPNVQRRLEELNNKFRHHVSRWSQAERKVPIANLLEWPLVKKQNPGNNNSGQAYRTVGPIGFSLDPTVQWNRLQQSKPLERKIQKFIPLPKEETLSRHSILGPNGLHGRWQAPIVDREIKYPSNLDLTPIVISSVESAEDKSVTAKESGSVKHERSILEEVLSLNDGTLALSAEEPSPMISLDVPQVKTNIIREPSPPSVPVEVQDLVAITSHDTFSTTGGVISLEDELLHSKSPLQVHISTTMMDSFMRLAKSNTERNLETCGVLAGSLKNKKFYVTALIIPKQESTSDSCQTTNEEEIFEYQDKQSLFPLGWIHTHPTQSCFMSSIDIHTHYSYQTMLPEAIAIVMAPKDTRKNHGIFRLTAPGGMSVIRHCQERGFHPHHEPPGGGPIYDGCSNVYMDPNLEFDVKDLR